jgi:gliding motility-associated protein GldL
MRTKFLTFPKVLNFLVSIGASIVVFGALMKITHRNNADTFLTIGLVTESIIFLIYAFIPPKEEPSINELMESMPKLVASSTSTQQNTDEIEKFNQHLSEANKLFEKLKMTLKG